MSHAQTRLTLGPFPHPQCRSCQSSDDRNAVLHHQRPEASSSEEAADEWVQNRAPLKPSEKSAPIQNDAVYVGLFGAISRRTLTRPPLVLPPASPSSGPPRCLQCCGSCTCAKGTRCPSHVETSYGVGMRYVIWGLGCCTRRCQPTSHIIVATSATGGECVLCAKRMESQRSPGDQPRGCQQRHRGGC